MMYVCKECGEKENFKRNITGTAEYSEIEYLNEFGENVNYSDRDWNDENTDRVSEIFCNECDSGAIEVTDEEWENFVFEEKNEKEKTIILLKDKLIK